MVLVEVCAESVESAMTAQRAGAYRVELCDNLAEGGTTPSCGQILEARKNLTVKLYPIIRPRGGDFLYTDIEYGIMRRDVVFCGESGCDGVVFGMLDADGNVDTCRCGELVELARRYGMGVTFHRAFDASADRGRALEDIVAIGCERVLTSGGAATAAEGVGAIRSLIVQAAGRITVMPGCGVAPENMERIILGTGCVEIHGTFRSRYGSRMNAPNPDHAVWHADPHKVREAVAIAERLSKFA